MCLSIAFSSFHLDFNAQLKYHLCSIIFSTLSVPIAAAALSQRGSIAQWFLLERLPRLHIYVCIGFLSFILSCIIFIDLSMLNCHCIPGLSPTWSWCINFLMCCIQDVSTRTHFLVQLYNFFLPFFICKIAELSVRIMS